MALIDIYFYSQLAEEAGVPAGVLNVVTCSRDYASEVGKELCENTLVSKISFTGSTAVGKVGSFICECHFWRVKTLWWLDNIVIKDS